MAGRDIPEGNSSGGGPLVAFITEGIGGGDASEGGIAGKVLPERDIVSEGGCLRRT